MDEKRTDNLESEIKNEIDFARAVTALMMAVKADISEVEANRAVIRLNSNYKVFESDIEKRAS